VTTTSILGKVDLTVNEGFSLVSFPLDKSNAAIATVIGDQLTGNNIPSLADRVFDFDEGTGAFDQYFRRADGEWRKVGETTPTTYQVSSDDGYWINVATGNGTQTITVVGMASANPRTITLVAGFNLVGNAFAFPKDIVNANLQGTGNNIPTLADRIFLFNPGTGTFDQVFQRADGEWRKVGETGPTTERFEISEGFWMNIINPYTWSYQ